MFKILVYALSCSLFLSGCGNKKSDSTRAKSIRTKPTPAQASAQPAGAQPRPETDMKRNTPDQALPGLKTPDAPIPSVKTDESIADDRETTLKTLPDVPAAPVPEVDSSKKEDPKLDTKDDVKVTKPGNEDEKKSSEKAKAPEAPKAKEEAADTLIKLTLEETRNLDLTLRSQFSESTLESILVPIVPQNLEADNISITFEGDHDKPLYSILNKDKKLVEFKDFAFSRSKQTKVKVGNYNLLGLCSEAKCEVIFVAVYKVENKKVTENYPAILKWVDNRYQAAERLESAELQEALLKEGKLSPEDQLSKAPPQLRVKYLLEKNMKTHFPSLIERLDVRMKKDNAIYSARFFVNIKTGSFDWIWKRTEDSKTSLSLKIEFTELEKREAVEFSDVIPARGATLTDKSGITMDIYHIIKDEFYMMVFESQNFQSQLPNSKKAIQAYVCQVLVESGETFSECEPLYSTYVLGNFAQEGRIGGPVLVNVGADGKPIIIEKYKPLTIEELTKQATSGGQ